METLRSRRSELEAWLDGKQLSRTLSASRYLLHRKLTRFFEEFVEGRVLEAGAGGSPFSEDLRGLARVVVTLDLNDRYGETDVIGDIQQMPEIESGSFDVVICTQVLEHVPQPGSALREMRRVLTSGGVLILSAPHLSMIHEAPADYFRYTSFGLQELCKRTGFQVTLVEPTGGLLAFLFHPISVLLLTTLGTIPLLRWLTWAINYVVLVRGVAHLDRLLGFPKLFPLDHILVAVADDAARLNQSH